MGSLIETKIEVDLANALRKTLRLGGQFAKTYRLKAFRRFINSVDGDYEKFRIAGIDVMSLYESVLLVKAKVPCVQVSKLVAKGALEQSEPDASDNTKSIWYTLTNVPFQFSGVSISKDELDVLMTVKDGDKICRGPYMGVDRCGKLVQIPQDLIDDAIFNLHENGTKCCNGLDDS